MNFLNKFFSGVHRERDLGPSGPPNISVEEFLQYPEDYLNKGWAVWGLGKKQQVVELDQLLRTSLLITSRDRRARLYGLVQTAVEANEAEKVEPVIITPDRNFGLDAVNSHDNRHFSSRQSVFSPNQTEAQEVIVDLARIVEQRRSGRNSGRTFLLAIDELHEFAGEQLDDDVAGHLGWLIEEGHNGGVLTVATADINVLNQSPRGGRLLKSFPAKFHEDGI